MEKVKYSPLQETFISYLRVFNNTYDGIVHFFSECMILHDPFNCKGEKKAIDASNYPYVCLVSSLLLYLFMLHFLTTSLTVYKNSSIESILFFKAVSDLALICFVLLGPKTTWFPPFTWFLAISASLSAVSLMDQLYFAFFRIHQLFYFPTDNHSLFKELFNVNSIFIHMPEAKFDSESYQSSLEAIRIALLLFAITQFNLIYLYKYLIALYIIGMCRVVYRHFFPNNDTDSPIEQVQFSKENEVFTIRFSPPGENGSNNVAITLNSPFNDVFNDAFNDVVNDATKKANNVLNNIAYYGIESAKKGAVSVLTMIKDSVVNTFK